MSVIYLIFTFLTNFGVYILLIQHPFLDFPKETQPKVVAILNDVTDP